LDKVITNKYVKKVLSQHLVCHMVVHKYLMELVNNLIKKMMFTHGLLYYSNYCSKDYHFSSQDNKQIKYSNKECIWIIYTLFLNNKLNMVRGKLCLY
jgi:hypothetical protein